MKALFLSASLAAALLPLSAGADPETPLLLNNVRASDAAARLGTAYHSDIVLRANTARRVNVALDDSADAGARLQTVNALANALRLDFTKTIVVSKAAADRPAGGPDAAAVDSDASIPFGRTTLPAREAIALIAGVDDAFVRMPKSVGGTVTLSRPTLTVGQAEEEVARQTGTTWKAVYVLAPRALVASTASPFIVFPDRQWEAEQRREEAEAERQAAQAQAAYQAAYQQATRQASPQSAALGTQGMNGQATNGNGYYPNGYGSYGSPYQNGGYGNGGYGNGGYGNGGYGNGGYPYDTSGFGFGTNTSGNAGANFPSSGNAGGSFPNHIAGQ